MSDTPKTEAQLTAVYFTDGKVTHAVDPEFARTLERENAQLRKEREETLEILKVCKSRLRLAQDGDYKSLSTIEFEVKLNALLAKLEGGR